MSTREKTIYNALPKLPTYNFPELNEPASHRRRQLCVVGADGTRGVLDAPGARLADAPMEDGCGIPVQVILDHFPDWQTLDDKVLRLFAYYVEQVSESMIEEERVRKVVVHYHLADGTLRLAETPAVVNSGLRKGATVSRFKPENVDIFSLCVGSSLHCRGIDYELVDCDAATREFFEVMGIPQPDALDYPYDKFEASKAPRPMGVKDEQHVEMKRAVEVRAAVLAGTHASLLTTEERAAARGFFENDGNVLRFYAVWDRRQFRIQYYLADNTISIMFDAAPNAGRDTAPVFLRRGKIPKDTCALLRQTETLNRPVGPAPEYVTWADLRTGATVDLNTRPFFIYDCDEHTRQFMAAQGVDMTVCPRPQSEQDDYAASKHRPSKDERESSGRSGSQKRFGASAMVFDESTGDKDPVQMARFAQDVFRFVGRVACPRETDTGRRFIVSYFLSDDTVSVYELVVRNSGHVGGKIFARRTVAGIDSPRKLAVGQVVLLDGVGYALDAMDDRTRRDVEAGMPDNLDDEHFRIADLIATARQAALQRFNRTQDLFRHYASSGTMGLARDNMVEVFADAGLHPSAADMDAVMARVDSDGDGWVSLADFTDRFLAQQFTSDFRPHSTLAALVAVGGDPDAKMVPRGPIRSAEAIAGQATAERQADAAFRKFLTLTEARRTLLTRSFRSVAEGTYDGSLSVTDFVTCVTERLRVPMTEDEVGALVYKFFYLKGLPNWTARRLPFSEVQRLVLL